MGCRPVVVDAASCGWVARRPAFWISGPSRGLVPASDRPPQPLFSPTDVLAGKARPFHTFTREFCHPADRVHQASSEAASRFYADSQRFPPSAYEEGSLL